MFGVYKVDVTKGKLVREGGRVDEQRGKRVTGESWSGKQHVIFTVCFLHGK